MTLTAVADLREVRPLAGAVEIEAFEVDVLAGFVLARAAAGLADGTIASDVGHLTQVRMWFQRPLWEMEPADADRYFAKVLGGAAKGTRLSRAGSLRTYFAFLELRHKVEIHNLTGRVVECPIDEMNRASSGLVLIKSAAGLADGDRSLVDRVAGTARRMIAGEALEPSEELAELIGV